MIAPHLKQEGLTNRQTRLPKVCIKFEVPWHSLQASLSSNCRQRRQLSVRGRRKLVVEYETPSPLALTDAMEDLHEGVTSLSSKLDAHRKHYLEATDFKPLIETRASFWCYSTQPTSFHRCGPSVIQPPFLRSFTLYTIQLSSSTSCLQKASRPQHDPSQGPPPATESSSSAARAFVYM